MGLAEKNHFYEWDTPVPILCDFPNFTGHGGTSWVFRTVLGDPHTPPPEMVFSTCCVLTSYKAFPSLSGEEIAKSKMGAITSSLSGFIDSYPNVKYNPF